MAWSASGPNGRQSHSRPAQTQAASEQKTNRAFSSPASVTDGAQSTLSEPLSPHNPWPTVKITDRLTIRFKNEAPLSFKPAAFGLQPVACRDLIVRLRDDPRLRSRLPEFDSVRDLALGPVVAGELIEPRL